MIRNLWRALPLVLLLFIRNPQLCAANPFEEYVRSTPWLSPADEQTKFILPPGFEIQLVASEPEIAKPISTCFDARGRLWVAETRVYPFESASDKTPRDTIRILSNFGEDGRAHTIETFADGLNTPDAVAPFKDGAIVFSIPNIVRLEDRDGDGQAEKHDVLFGPFACRDTHNMANNFRRGFDGWLYGGHGVANDTSVKGVDGHEVKMKGATFRFRPDGSRIEKVGDGQVNVFGICFDPLGNVFSSDCHSSPIYQVLYGAFYPMFGKPDDGLGFGPTMMRHTHGSTAIAGLAEYDDNRWPAEFRGNMFLGNVMTSRINRDRLSESGSTKIAHEMPDLVSTSDPWFRPVDVQLGPDGALYVADFYNRIIAHVEVPLNHPGRDRTSGRIWRIVYRGPDGKLALRARRDLSKVSVVEEGAALDDANFPYALTALNHLVDRGGDEVIGIFRAVLRAPQRPPIARALALWGLERLNGLAAEELTLALHDNDRLLRTHGMRILTERKELDAKERDAAVAGLQDPDAFVARTAADALARHPRKEYVAPLLALRKRAPAEDTHLTFMARKALRDQLLDSSVFGAIARQTWSEEDAKAIADIAIAVPSAEAANYLLGFVQKFGANADALVAQLRHIARYVSALGVDAIAEFTRAKFADDLEFQVDQFHGIMRGLNERGLAISPIVNDWGADLAWALLDPSSQKKLAWTNTPIPGVENQANPWFVQNRPSGDGNRAAPFLCSLPPGGESLTGVLRSAVFNIPSRLAFWVAGHDGPPETQASGKNLVRLRDVVSDEIIAQSPAPRNDLAQEVQWDLSKYHGRQGVIEIVDTDTRGAFAWIAAGRFEPPVAPIPVTSPSTLGQRLKTAADLAGTLKLHALEMPLAAIARDAAVDVEARTAAVRALLALNPREQLGVAAAILNDPSVPVERRSEIGRTVGEQNSAEARNLLTEALRTAPQRLQSALAQGLVSTAEGAEALLQAVSDGHAPAQLVADRVIKEKVLAVRPGAAPRLALLTAHLKPASERLQKIIEERRDGFLRSKPRADAGRQVFISTCAVCHSVNGEGGNIGPQLDGAGNRGLERLCEDILDPNRNVDRIFRYSVITLADGTVVSGLLRREEGALLVLADPTGKELTVRQQEIRERTESDTSLMPEIFADTIAAPDFYNLMAYLLSTKSARQDR